ncbi:hypothetical protein QTP70_012567 [Hemibagrus guttatus]|uniref:Uncharacterized protein n=1 Tax=Hemibagrus guttatus TaxID=175788 RepID=A0AAE0UU50_9TELE|nr:hypothetical protein QTP70_012567 [Hemibagrus guttatus]
MRKARGAKKAPSPWDPHSDKKLREAPNDLLRCADDGGAAPRARKKGYKPPDVRSIFGAQGRRGEGHEFREEASEGWCDVCCAIIFQGGLMCTATFLEPDGGPAAGSLALIAMAHIRFPGRVLTQPLKS